MPCYTEETEYERQEPARVEAALCAVLTVMEKNMTEKSFKQYIDSIDWKEAGVSKKWFLTWWKEHKERDAARRRFEAAERKKKERVKHLREKMNLTDEEWKLLREDLKYD